jgi:hypothetical protein
MIRLVRLNQGIVGGVEKELLVDILPQLAGSFRRRKEYYEYYFDEKEIELSLEDINDLSSEFIIKLNWEELKILI